MHDPSHKVFSIHVYKMDIYLHDVFIIGKRLGHDKYEHFYLDKISLTNDAQAVITECIVKTTPLRVVCVKLSIDEKRKIRSYPPRINLSGKDGFNSHVIHSHSPTHSTHQPNRNKNYGFLLLFTKIWKIEKLQIGIQNDWIDTTHNSKIYDD